MKLQVSVVVLLTVFLSLILSVGLVSGGEGEEGAILGGSNQGSDTGVEAGAPVPDPAETVTKPTTSSNECVNGTDCEKTLIGNLPLNQGMLLRTLYVLVAVTGVIILYFVVRTIRIRRRKRKSKKYGVITPASDMEMTPLDQDEDDEDMTVFEVNGIPK